MRSTRQAVGLAGCQHGRFSDWTKPGGGGAPDPRRPGWLRRRVFQLTSVAEDLGKEGCRSIHRRRYILGANQRRLPFRIELVLESVPVAQLDLVRFDHRAQRLLEEDRQERILGYRRILQRSLSGWSVFR